MAVGQPWCSGCEALLILQTGGHPVATPYASGANDFHSLRLPSLADDMDRIDARGGVVQGERESFDELPDQDPVQVTCRCRQPYDLDRCQQRAPYGFIPQADGLPLACKAFDEARAS